MEFDQAFETYCRALACARPNGYKLSEALILKRLGDVLSLRMRRDDALDHYHQALVIFRSIGNSHGETQALKSIVDLGEQSKLGPNLI
jgi:hypothetical protein